MGAPNLDQKEPSIRRGRVDSLTIYEVKEEELRIIEHGSTRSDQFNYAVAMLSAALTLVVTLLTAKFPSDAATAIAVAFCTTFTVLGIFFLTSWLRSKDEVKDTLKIIRDRAVGDPNTTQRRIAVPNPAFRPRVAPSAEDAEEPDGESHDIAATDATAEVEQRAKEPRRHEKV